MSVKYVDEYLEEMCDICHDFTYGVFVNMNSTQICEKCCQTINKQLALYEIENQ